MESLLVKPKDEAELKLISDLLKKMRISNKLLSQEEQEDLGLTMLLKQTDRTQKVPREDVLAKLGRK